MYGESSAYSRSVLIPSRDSNTTRIPTTEDLELISLKSMEFNKSEAIYSLMKPSNSNYLAVGVIGGPGVGKSSILNSLLGKTLFEYIEVCFIDLELEQMNQESLPPFKIATLDSISQSQHTTTSVDIRVNDLRLMGLDSQAMCSPSVLLKMLTHVSPCMELARGVSVAALQGARPSQASAEALYRILSIQVSTFLLCSCHVVLVVMDGPLDEQIIDLWKTSELFAVMIRASLSDCRLEDNKEMDLARVVLVGANCLSEDMSLDSFKSKLKQHASFSKLFQPTSQLDSMYFLTPFEVAKGGQRGSSAGDHVNHKSLSRLRSQLMSMKEKRVQDLTELAWLKRCQTVWDAIWKSKEIGEHFFELQKTLYKGGVGL